jgi:hypothetical protein
MRRSVLFWAQETYADARTWGVDGSTLTQRSAYLNDYFLHGVRLAAAGDGRTEAARAFFAAAYTPIANASYRWPNPGPNQRDRFRLHRHRPGRDAELRLEADLRPPLVHPRAIRVRLGAAPRGCGRDARSRRAARRRDQGLRDRRERRLRRGRRVVLPVPYAAVGDIIEQLGVDLGGKVVVDITNPVDWDTRDSLVVPGPPPARRRSPRDRVGLHRGTGLGEHNRDSASFAPARTRDHPNDSRELDREGVHRRDDLRRKLSADSTRRAQLDVFRTRTNPLRARLRRGEAFAVRDDGRAFPASGRREGSRSARLPRRELRRQLLLDEGRGIG